MKIIAVLVLALASTLAPGLAQAHDFWMDFGSEWRAEPGQSLEMRFLVGHAGESEDWNFRRERIVSFRHVAPDGDRDLSHALVAQSAERPAGAKIALKEAGSRLIAFETDEIGSELPADKFDAYLREEGLTLAIAARVGSGDAPGREVYSRRAKAIVQIGDIVTDTVSAPVSHTLEITPEKNPLMLEKGEPLPVRVTFRGKPLEGASIHLESLSVGLIPEETKITDADGRAAFLFPHNGAWKLDVVWSEPIGAKMGDDPQAEFRTIFASLTFGY